MGLFNKNTNKLNSNMYNSQINEGQSVNIINDVANHYVNNIVPKTIKYMKETEKSCLYIPCPKIITMKDKFYLCVSSKKGKDMKKFRSISGDMKQHLVGQISPKIVDKCKYMYDDHDFEHENEMIKIKRVVTRA